MRPRGMPVASSTPNPSGLQDGSPMDVCWRDLCESLIRSEIIDPDLVEAFRNEVATRYSGNSRSLSYSTIINSPYLGPVSGYLHRELRQGLNLVQGGSDAGGDELRIGVLRSAEDVRTQLASLYSIIPTFYDLRDINGAGMHIHVGRGTAEHTRDFERFMIAREWVFQCLVPRYRRHGYNRVWRTDTMMALAARGVIANGHANLLVGLSPVTNAGSRGHPTFDGDIQSFFYDTPTPSFSAYGVPTNVSPEMAPALWNNPCPNIFSSPLQARTGHWITGGRTHSTTEFRLFAPPSQGYDVVNWIRTLNHIWTFTRDNPTRARRRSNITPWLTAPANISLLAAECSLPSDLVSWMNGLTSRMNNHDVY